MFCEEEKEEAVSVSDSSQTACWIYPSETALYHEEGFTIIKQLENLVVKFKTKAILMEAEQGSLLMKLTLVRNSISCHEQFGFEGKW